MSIKDKYLNTKDWAKNNLTKENLKSYFAGSAAMTAILVPVSSFIDTVIAGVSDWESIKARLIVTGITFLGLGIVPSKVGGWSRNFLNLEPKPNTDTFRHDSTSLAVGSLMACPAFYYYFGSSGFWAGVAGTLATAVISPVILGTTNLFRNVAGLKESYSINFFNNLKPKTRKGLVSLIAAASIVSTAAVYNFNQDTKSLDPIKQEISEIYSSSKKSLENYLIK
jgi:hypothetical protein